MASTYEKIASNTVTGSAVSTITFSSIPSTYTDLVIVVNAQETTANYGLWRCNNDSGNNYSRIYLLYNGTSILTATQSSNSSFYWNGENASSNWCVNYIQIPNYAQTTGTKQVLQHDGQGATTTIGTVERWNSSSAIDRIDFLSAGGGNAIAVGSSFTLYGITKA